jgi:cell division protein ZapA
MSEELMPINVWLGGRSYRLLIKPEEESAVRKAVKIADDKLSEMRNSYAGKNDTEFLAMCLLSYAADTAVLSMGNPLVQNELTQMADKIQRVLDAEVGEA